MEGLKTKRLELFLLQFMGYNNIHKDTCIILYFGSCSLIEKEITSERKRGRVTKLK